MRVTAPARSLRLTRLASWSTRQSADRADSPAEEEGYQTAISHIPLSSPSWTFFDPYTTPLCSSANASSSSGANECGPAETYTSFGPPGSPDNKRIDFTFVATGKLPAASTGISAGGGAQAPLSGQGYDGRYPTQEGAGPIGYGGWKAKKYQVVDNVIKQDGKEVQARWSDHRAVRVTIERV